MTLRSKRRNAATIGMVTAAWSVIVIVLAQFVTAPALIWGGAALAALGALVAAVLAVKVSVRLEESDLVYRSSSREKRFPVANGIGCKQAGTNWVFYNAAGTRLFLLNGLMFEGAEVAAFIAKANFAYEGAPEQAVDKLRRNAGRLKFSRAIGVLGGAFFIVITGLSASAQDSAQRDLSRYEAVAQCEPAAPPNSNCKQQTKAMVTGIRGSYKGDTTLDLTLIPGGGDYPTTIRFSAPEVGAVVAVEVWSGRILTIDGRPTLDDPPNNPNLDIPVVINGFGAAAIFMVFWAAAAQYALVDARARLRDAGRPPGQA